MLGTPHTDNLLNALTDLHYIHDKEHLYTFVLNRCSDVLKAQSGTFFSVREETAELYPEATKGISLSLLREIPFKMKMGVSGWVATNRTSVVIENAQGDERFNRAVDVITGIRTRSLLCVPVTRKDRILGVIELVNRVDGVFREPDQEFVEHLAKQVAVAIENCDLFENSRHLVAYTNSVLESLTGGFLSTDTSGNVTRCNAAACRILGINEPDVRNRPILSALPQYPAFSAILDVTQKHEAPVQRQEIQLERPDGGPLVIGYSTFLIRDANRSVLGAAVTFQDLTHLKRAS
jgi:PAS domain S-box-containing protein